MKIKGFIIFCMLCAGMVCGQQTPDAFLFSTDATPPTIIPQSPEVGNLGRYGNIPITSATGQMSYSVPFYTIEVDGHSWPIGLNYNYGGLILEGKPSLMGLGWSLQGEAAVTREIRGLADEEEFGYYSRATFIEDGSSRYIKDAIDQYMAYENDGNVNTKGWDAWDYYTVEKFKNGVYDAEVDKFTVNAGGLNFSFKLKNYVYASNGAVISAEPYFLSKHANKVELEWLPANNSAGSQYNSYISAFTVTDTQGTTYRFDVLEQVIPQGTDSEMQNRPITAWKLSKITYLNNQAIDFQYHNNSFYDYSFRASGSTLRTNGTYDGVYPNGIVVGPYNPTTTIDINPAYGEGINEAEIERKILSGIIFPKGHINFVHSNTNGRERYSRFELFNEFDAANPIRVFDFSYSGNRDVLDKIDFNNEKHYQFEYHDELAVPPFIQSVTDLSLARKQDKWKYYNGANNPYALNIANSPFTGANTDPNLLYGRLGALKRIIYPTGGSTNIYYEQNQIKTDFVADSNYYESLAFWKTLDFSFDPSQLSYENNELEKIQEITFDEPTVAVIRTSIEGERCANHIVMSLSRRDGQYNYPITHEGVTLPPFPGANDFYYDVAPWLRDQIVAYNFPYTIPPMYPQYADEYGPDDGACGFNTFNQNSSGKILIMPGTYVLRGYSSIVGTTATGSIEIDLFGQPGSPPPTAVNKNVGGLRVSYLKDCPDGLGVNCFITDYDYNDADGLSTGALYANPLLETNYILDYIPENQSYTVRKEYRTFLFTQYTVENAGTGTPVFYNRIKTIKRDNGSGLGQLIPEIGYTETGYSFPYENLADLYPKRPTGVDLDKSLPIWTKAYREQEAEPISSTETIFTPIRKTLEIASQQDEDNEHPWSLKVVLGQYRFVDWNDGDYSVFPPVLGTSADDKIKALNQVLPYRELDIWDRQQTVTQELDGITTTVQYSYNGNQMVIEEKTTDSRGNESMKETQYANEAGLSAMVAINQIGTPVEVKNYYNGQLQGTRKTEFVANELGYKPSRILTAKGDSDLEAKLQFTYQGEGKLRQVDRLLDSPNRPGNGNEKVLSSTAYVWGYNSEFPVVKVDNATYGEVLGAGADLSILQNEGSSLTNKKNQLTTLRNGLPNAFVSGYVHQPLVGISTMIDPRGYATNYAYENLNRLKNIKDEQDKMLEEYEYAYRSENYTNPDVIGQYPALGGSINGPNNVDFGAVVTYTVNPTGGSEEYTLAWYQDGNFLTSGLAQVDITFASGSSSELLVEVTDNVTGENHTITKTVNIATDLGALQLTATPSVALVGETFTINSSGINQALTGLSYAWYVDNSPNPETFTGESGFQTSFATSGQHSVKLVVTHGETNSFVEDEITISVLDPITNLTLTPSETVVFTGESITFTPSGLGFHGIIDIEWSVIGPSGTEILTYEGVDPHSIPFTAPGNYEVVFSVISHTIPSGQASANISVSGGLVIDDLVPSAENVLLSSQVTFAMPNITGGSGNYEFDWIVENNVESNTSGSFTINGFAVQGDYEVKLRVRDLDLDPTRNWDSSPVTISAWKGLVQSAIGASSNPIYVGQAVNFSTISNLGSGSNTTAWYVTFENNAESFEGNSSVLTKTFGTPGTYTVRQVITDNLIANHSVETSQSFEVYQSLSVGNITTGTNKIIRGSSITFTAPSVQGGSNNKNYEWLVNNVVRSTSSGNFTYSQFNTAGDYTVRFRVIDNGLGITEEAPSITVNVYDPLNDPSFLVPVNHIEVGEDLYMGTSGIGGGSGSRNYKWYVKLNSGSYTQISGASGTDITYNGFNSVGAYTIKFRVTDNNVPSHYKEVEKVVNVYSPIQINNSDISTPSPIDPNTNTYFNINSASGGSGSFEYEWDVIHINSNYTEGLSPRSEANRNVSSYLISDQFIGSTKIQCRVHDLVTNKYKTVSQTITVNSYGPLQTPLVLSFDTDNDPESAYYRLTASSSGGSNQHRFRWIVDDVVVQESTSSIYEFVVLNCSKQSAVVKCVVIDEITGGQAGPRVINLSIAGNCGNQ